MTYVPKFSIGDLAKRPGLARFGALLGLPPDGKVPVLSTVGIKATFECGAPGKQLLRAAPKFKTRKPWYDAVIFSLCKEVDAGASLAASDAQAVLHVGDVEHCSAIPCHSMLWRDVTLQFVLYFDIVFDVIACTSFWGHPFLGAELREISEVDGRDFEGL